MRGTLLCAFLALHPLGIIPAYAGNTIFPFSSLLFAWDHPRVCGEHVAFDAPEITLKGSSPRMRGTRLPAG